MRPRFRVSAADRRYRIGRRTAAVVIAAVLIVLPLSMANATQVDALSQIIAYAVAIAGLALVTGYCGQISIGHSAFVGLGAYTTVILVANHGWSYLATVPVSAALCLIAGTLVGIPALRISGLYLAAVTLAVAAVFPTLVDQFASLTGGPNGLLANSQMQPPSWMPYAGALAGPSIFHYWVILAIAALMFALARNLVSSRVGRALIAIRDSPYSAASAGIRVSRYKVMAFAVSAAFAGVAGSLLMIVLPSVSDNQFDLTFSILLVIGLIAGGRTTIAGAIPGALVVALLHRYIPNWINGLNIGGNGVNGEQLVGVVSGAGLIAFAFLLPDGVAESLRRVFGRVVRVAHPPPDGWQRYVNQPSTSSGPLAPGGGPISTPPGPPADTRKDHTA